MKNLFEKLIVLFIVLLAGIHVYAKTVTVKVEYIYQLPENVTPEEAKSIALQRAQCQAIADEFGTIVSQTSTVRIDTYDSHTTTDFLSIGGSELKGEWLETIGIPEYEFVSDGGQIALKVKVEGRIRELEGSKVPFDIKILKNGVSDANEADHFCSGDDLYVSFNSPASGYLAIYLIDTENRAYCLLPYQSNDTGMFQTKANHRYLLFHSQYGEGAVKSSEIDEFTVDTSLPKERNRILTIFSPNRFFKAADNKTGVDLPRNLNYSDFQDWLSKVKKRDMDMSIAEKCIMISAN